MVIMCEIMRKLGSHSKYIIIGFFSFFRNNELIRMWKANILPVIVVLSAIFIKQGKN